MEEEKIQCCKQEIKPLSFGHGFLWFCPICKRIIKYVNFSAQKQLAMPGDSIS
jgi:hypothetical protein